MTGHPSDSRIEKLASNLEAILQDEWKNLQYE